MIRAAVGLSAGLGLGVLAGYVLLGGPRLPRDVDAVIERVGRSDLSSVVTGDTGYARSGSVRLWYESVPPAGTERGVVLLNMAMAGDALFWPPAFIHALTSGGYRVIRYDQRGTGASDWIENWNRDNPYSLLDMADDVVAILAELSVSRAHLVGLSLGGFVAQEVAIAHPDRVASLTLMSTAADPTDGTLPGPRLSALARFALRGLPLLRYRLLGGEANLVKERIAKIITTSGPASVNVAEVAAVVLYDLRERRGVNLKAFVQHQAAVATTRSRYDLLKKVRSPALIIHGTDDSLIPIAHAQKLAQAIPNAEHLWLDGVGHEFPYPDMATVITVMLNHFERATGRPS
jgi:pimeloyl-ACP methyl ester carboxylesterase